MYLTDREIDFIFGENIADNNPVINTLIFGHRKDTIEEGLEVFRDIDKRLKEDIGLPAPHQLILKEYSDFSMAAPNKLAINGQIELSAQLTTHSSFSPYNSKCNTSDRPKLLQKLISANIRLIENFLFINKISKHNINSLTLDKFKDMCEKFFNCNVEVTPKMLDTFKNFVKTSFLTQDVALTVNGLNIAYPYRFSFSDERNIIEKIATNLVYKDIMEKAKQQGLEKPSMLRAFKENIKKTKSLLVGYFPKIKAIGERYGEIVLLGIPILIKNTARKNFEHFYNIPRIPESEIFNTTKSMALEHLASMEEFATSKKIETKTSLLANIQRMKDKTFEQDIQQAIEGQDIILGAPPNPEELIEQHFYSSLEMLKYIQNGGIEGKAFIDTDNLIIYTYPKMQESDIIISPNPSFSNIDYQDDNQPINNQPTNDEPTL